MNKKKEEKKEKKENENEKDNIDNKNVLLFTHESEDNKNEK